MGILDHSARGQILGQYLFRLVTLISEWISARALRAWYSLIWDFEGPAHIQGMIEARAIRGHVRIGRYVTLRHVAQIDCIAGARITIGRGTTLNRGVYIVARDAVAIGENVMVGEYVSIRDNDHAFADTAKLIRDQGFSTAPVTIEDDVWIGRGAVIGKGTRVGRGAIVAANAVVTRDVPPMCIVAGVPARKIKQR